MSSASAPRLPRVVRSRGVTPAEQFLQRLCDRSFLSLWSYPGLFRDQKTGGKGDGKELCDLLVVFGSDLLIFSDKSCAFPDSGNLGIDWSRWFRKGVMQAANQGWGAERWIREHPSRVFLDRLCTEPFPLEFPAADAMRFHHIVVAHNVAERCAAYFGNGSSGTLMFDSDLRGRDHYGDPGRCIPFQVGWLDSDRRFVHVLDDVSLEILLNTRDTITDFVEYLSAKEELLHSYKDRGIALAYAGEEELLANFLLTMNENRHGFAFPEGYNSIAIPEGDWAWFQSSPQRAAQLAADRVSYAWDALIETFNSNILGGTSHKTSSLRISDREKLMRFLAREPRVRRRLLAESFLEILERTGPRHRATRVMSPSNPGDPYYCFLLLPRLPSQSSADYRAVRSELLKSLCCVTKVVCPEALDIIGIATETGITAETRSEDAFHLDARYWTQELESEARRAQRELGLLVNVTRGASKVAEFPI